MVPSLILQLNILFWVTMPTILLILNSAVAFPIDEETYLNPWRTRNKLNPKVVEFDSNGDVKLKDISNDHVLTPFSTLPEHVKKAHTNNVLNMDDLIMEMNSLIPKKKKNTRLKVLTRCDKTGLCRFLTCPNIKVNCILCEVNLRERSDENTTHCETHDTAFLSK